MKTSTSVFGVVLLALGIQPQITLNQFRTILQNAKPEIFLVVSISGGLGVLGSCVGIYGHSMKQKMIIYLFYCCGASSYKDYPYRHNTISQLPTSCKYDKFAYPKHDDLKQEIKTLSPLKLPLSNDIVPAELDDIIKAESVIDFIASEVTKRIVSCNNVIVYNIPDKIPIKTERISILKASKLQDSQCQFIRLNKEYQKYSCPILIRFDSHILAEQLRDSERLICVLTKFRKASIVSDKTINQRLTQKRTLNENKGVEIIISHDASAAVSTDAATLSGVLQYSDLLMKVANLPIMPVVTSDNQCTSNDDTNPIFSSLPLESHKKIPSYNGTTLKTLSRLKSLCHVGRIWITSLLTINPTPTSKCLNCPHSQVQQINPLYQNNDFLALHKSLVD
ncbi:unnamed protein product [Schistosoma margrebowiei]|uniref:Uncharacterized protein n=1 Tax=Schistosoma margrebowiei TaxID=48269 RepID=A0A183N5C4_9TREM|nr:unnamed protein product [Schistosoma margrebowiei]